MTSNAISKFAPYIRKSGVKSLLACAMLAVSGLAQAAPGASNPVSPTGNTQDSTPTYTFSEVTDSTWYQFWVQDSGGVKINQWYTSAQANCGSGICSITPTTTANGNVSWWIRTWNSSGIGPWSTRGAFTVAAAGGIPQATTLLGPTDTFRPQPIFSWQAVANATQYQLWVNDSNGAVKINTQYTAEEANCGAGTGTCYVYSDSRLAAERHSVWIRTHGTAGAGPWSARRQFTLLENNTLVSADNATVQAQMHAAINLLRSTPTFCATADNDQGRLHPARPPYNFSQALADAAQTHSEDMATNNFVSHTGSDGSSFVDRATAAGYTGFANGENAAAGSATVGITVGQWEGSGGHCNGLMSASATDMGGAGANSNTGFRYFWTLVFGCGICNPEEK